MSNTAAPNQLDEETERCISSVIGAMNWKRVHGKQLGDEVPRVVDALRSRIRQLVEEARDEHIGEMTHVDYDDD